MNIKDIIRSLLIFLHLDLTKNLEYDRLTKLIMKKVITKSSNCIDVGCHKGEILEVILNNAPMGKHFAFEPIPYLFNELENKFKNKVSIYPYALSNSTGETIFNLVKNAPAYSGINTRKYAIENPEIEKIKVQLSTLDLIIPKEIKINFLKIDVEGGELGVLKGAKELLLKDKPIVVFEFGIGASEYYGTTPLDLYNFLVKDIGLKISTLKAYIKNTEPLTLIQLEDIYKTNKDYYFIAY